MDIARGREELRPKVVVLVRERHLCGSFGYEQAPKSNQGKKELSWRFLCSFDLFYRNIRTRSRANDMTAHMLDGSIMKRFVRCAVHGQGRNTLRVP